METICVPIPSFFACPISWDLMRDPVILSTGVTYDRSSIEKWLEEGHHRCPVTNQVILKHVLIPNHTLRRLIQDWSAANLARAGVEIVPPLIKEPARKPPPAAQIERLLHTMTSSFLKSQSLKTLRSLARDGDKDGSCRLLEATPVPVLQGVVHGDRDRGLGNARVYEVISRELIEVCEHALGEIARLALNDGDKSALAGQTPLACLQWVISESRMLDAKVNAVEVLQNVVELDGICLMTSLDSATRVIQGLVSLLEEELHPRAIQAGLKCLLSLCSPRRNRCAAIEAGAIGALVELLPNKAREDTERALALLEIFTSCAEGREEIARHELAIPTIVKYMAGISSMATEHAVVALWAVLSYSSHPAPVLDAALQAGSFTKILVLMQSECTLRTKAKAAQVLKLLDEAWKVSPCPPNPSEERLIRMFRKLNVAYQAGSSSMMANCEV